MVPRTRLELVRFSPHAPQTCAATNYATSAWEKISKNYLFVVVFVAVFVAALVLVAVFASVFAGTSTFVFAGIATLAFVFASVLDSEVVCKTDMFPVKAGIARSNAESIKMVAAPMVIFDKIVAVPRGPNAALETLLVNSAPASVFPG